MNVNKIYSSNYKLMQNLPTHVSIKLKILIVNELALLYENKINIFRYISGLNLNHVRVLV